MSEKDRDKWESFAIGQVGGALLMIVADAAWKGLLVAVIGAVVITFWANWIFRRTT